MERLKMAAAIVVLVAACVGGSVQAHTGHVSHTGTDHGCSLWDSVPNPCDPDSNN